MSAKVKGLGAMRFLDCAVAVGGASSLMVGLHSAALSDRGDHRSSGFAGSLAVALPAIDQTRYL